MPQRPRRVPTIAEATAKAAVGAQAQADRSSWDQYKYEGHITTGEISVVLAYPGISENEVILCGK